MGVNKNQNAGNGFSGSANVSAAIIDKDEDLGDESSDVGTDGIGENTGK